MKIIKQKYGLFVLLSCVLTGVNAYDGGLVTDTNEDLCKGCIQPKNTSDNYYPLDEVGASQSDLSHYKTDLESEIVQTIEEENAYSGNSHKN